jgi:[acyl-carrier-protein] S-malonyltransferase
MPRAGNCNCDRQSRQWIRRKGHSRRPPNFEEEAVRSGAERIVRLKVHVASHTPRLANASAAFASSLAKAAICPEVPSGILLFSGIDGASVLDLTSAQIKLADQISHTVEWARCLESCREAGASAFLELGPGHALSAMAAEVDPQVLCGRL